MHPFLNLPEPVAVGAGNKAQISVVGCVSAAGYCIPPMIIYGRKTLSREMVKDEITGILYGLSPKGWIKSCLISGWTTFFITLLQLHLSSSSWMGIRRSTDPVPSILLPNIRWFCWDSLQTQHILPNHWTRASLVH